MVRLGADEAADQDGEPEVDPQPGEQAGERGARRAASDDERVYVLRQRIHADRLGRTHGMSVAFGGPLTLILFVRPRGLSEAWRE